MKHCNACNIQIQTPASHCPLCYSSLSKMEYSIEEPTYPNLTQQVEQYHLLLRLSVFLSIAIVSVCVTINLLSSNHYPWSLIVISCIAYIWVALWTATHKRRRIGFNLLMQFISLALFLLVLGNILHFEFSAYNIVLPSLVAASISVFNVLALVFRKQMQQFFIYYLIVALLGFVPLVLLLLHIITIAWPAIACALYSGISMLSMFVFAGRSTTTELKKRFHL